MGLDRDFVALPASDTRGYDQARHLRAVFVSAAERVVTAREALGQQRFPGLDGEATAVLVRTLLRAGPAIRLRG